MSKKIISGIQQMGIGVPHVEEIWKWYRTMFGMDVRIFEDAAEAPLMTLYTGGEVHKRTATLALSMDGGGGFEIWQFTSRPTHKAEFDIKLGDLGTYACRIKSHDVEKSFEHIKKNTEQIGGEVLGSIKTNSNGEKHFFVKDPNGNIFNIVPGRDWLSDTKHPSRCGGVAGALIGVSDIDKSLALYKDVLDYETVEFDETGYFDAFADLPDGNQKFRRVLLSHKQERQGPFSKLLGPTQIELVQAIDKKGEKIFKDRYWGDWGFIHLCFDVQGMEMLKSECEQAGFPFTVDSGDTFDMGEAGGRFSYIEDPDGNLIEFVETHSVPIMKKWGWYLNLKKRNPEKRLPNWMLKAMSIGNRVK